MDNIQDNIQSWAPEPRLWVRLTRTCNNHCLFCLDDDCQNGTVIGFKAVSRKLASGRKNGLTRVVLSGGEPTLHPDFLQIVAKCRAIGYTHIQVITNGRRFFYRDFMDEAIRAGVNEITFSIHAHTPKLNDMLTNMPGSFVESIGGLKYALSVPGLIVSVDIVVNKMNVAHLADILNFFMALGAMEFDLLHILPFGRAWTNRNRLFYDIGENARHLWKAFELSKNEEVHLWTNRFPPEALEGWEFLMQHPYKLRDEVKGRKRMFKAFLEGKGKLSCCGERCNYCVLNYFCRDMESLIKRGRLGPLPTPPCRPQAGRPYPDEFAFHGADDLEKFVDFFILHRHRAKSIRCRSCIFFNKCRGGSIFYIREHGFKSLNPVNAQAQHSHASRRA